ncbi:MAG: CoA transferase [Dehalococcoidia bacterium]|nr:CoA transferase [Dehalococcoidia bacterium]
MTPLDGVTVLDLTWHTAGPFATKLLADFGADVIKIERPGSGDPARQFGPFPPSGPDPEQSAAFAYLNTNKASVTLNLASDTGRRIALELAKSADIVVESFRPGVVDRLGIGYEALRAVKPDTILVSVSSFGQTGPYAQYHATDLTAWALTDVPYVTGNADRPPLRTAGAQAAIHAGINAVIGALTALWAREDTGEGAHVDVSVMEAVVNLIEFSLGLYECLGLVHRRRRATVAGFHPAGRQPTRDGEMFLMFGSRSGAEVAVALDLPALNDPKFATNVSRYRHREEFDAIFLPWLRAHRASDAFRILQERARMPVAKVMTLPELFEDEQYQARGFFVTIDHPVAGALRYPGPPFVMSATPAQYRRPAPRLGEDTERVLARLGYSAEDVAQLRRRGVV